MAKKKTSEKVAEAIEEIVEAKADETVKVEDVNAEDIALVDEETVEDESTLSDSVSKLADTITKAVEKKVSEPKAEPTKKPFKLGFWGYLGLALVVKGTVEIVKAITSRPKR